MRLFEEDLTRSVIGAFYAAYNNLGYGFLENVCIGALLIELEKRGHRVEREVAIPVHYHGRIIGSYRADLVVDGKLIVEVKSEAGITGVHLRQLRNYLCCSTYEVGLIVCFGFKPQHKRIIHTRDQKKLIAGSVAVSV